jgi:hypothetical protein
MSSMACSNRLIGHASLGGDAGMAGRTAGRKGQPYGEELTTERQERSGNAPAGRSGERAVAEAAVVAPAAPRTIGQRMRKASLL